MASVPASIVEQYKNGKLDLAGCYGNLTEFENKKLRKTYEILFKQFNVDICQVKNTMGELIMTSKADTEVIDEDKTTQGKATEPRKVYGSFRYGEIIQNTMTQTGKIVPVDFSSVVKDTTLGSLFFATLREERADSFVLRFLRARKWNPEKAADMLLYVVKFFHCENIERIIFYGESEIDASMLHKGLVFFQGRDKLNCPIVCARILKHFQNDQPFSNFKKFLIYFMEMARKFQRGSEKLCFIVDLTGFSMDNMDWNAVRLLLKYLELYYPEKLSLVIIYGSPWWFSGLFKMIKPLIDPVVASKIQFCKTGAELSGFITSSNIKTNRDNTIDYKYDYIPPKMNENELMKDLEGKKTALENHRKTCEEFKTLTEQWIDVHKHRSGSSQSASSDVNKISNARNACEEQLLESSLKLDKYTRAKNIYDRL